MDRPPKQILFLCTGNYYRSRFAEILFNHLARQAGIACTADSRALAIEVGIFNFGPISAHAKTGLERRKIPLPDPLPLPRQCTELDLELADRIIALKEVEHRPLLSQRYPKWPERVEYWHIHDLNCSLPDEALAQIEDHVRRLLDELQRENKTADNQE